MITRNITGKAKIAGIIGWPVGHSLSPVLHGYWLAEHGIDGALVPLPARAQDFAAILDGVRRAGFTGVNVTVPHKESAFALAHETDKAAQISGAANLLAFEGGRILARNTDGFGLQHSLREALGPDALSGTVAVMLGAGGAARGGLLALQAVGVRTVHILNRDPARAKSLAASLGKDITATLLPGALTDWPSVAGAAALLLNTTSAGMGSIPPLALDLGALNKNAAVCDIVYNPLETPLLKDAKARGHRTIDGLGMLMHQAVPSFEVFFGVRPAVTPGLRVALEKVLRDRG